MLLVQIWGGIFSFFLGFMPMVIGTLLIFNALKQWVVKTDRLTEV
jgi:hypothetical protein